MIKYILSVLFFFIFAYIGYRSYFTESFAQQPSTTTATSPSSCTYLQKQKRTPLGTFTYTNTDDSATCETIQTRYGTPYNYLENNGSVWCEAAGMAVLSNEEVAVYPKSGCIFHTPMYNTTCDELAVQFNTTTDKIQYKLDKRGASPPQTCGTSTHLPHNTLTQICRDAPSEGRALLKTVAAASDACVNPGCFTTLAECKRSCRNTANCKSVMYGKGECRLYNRETPLLNIDEETNADNMYSCLELEPLRYAGATNQLFGVPPACSGGGYCKTLGATGCNKSCIPPYTNNIPYTDGSIQNAWETIIKATATDTDTDTLDTSAFMNTLFD